jgi:hypothetical protein
MKYFLGEIFITHKKTWFGWIEYTENFSIILIEAKDWLTAKDKCDQWAIEKISTLNGKYRTRHFTTMAI